MKNFLLKIADIAGARQKKENPFAFSEREERAFAALSHSPEWRIYAEVLDKFCTLYAEEALAADATNRDYRAGFASGIRRAGTLVDEILQKRDADERAERDRGKLEHKRAELGRLQHFGSRFYPAAGNGIGERHDR